MNTFSEWINRELKLKEKEDMATTKKKKAEMPTITDLQLVLTNRVKSLVQNINESGVEYITYVTYSDITKLDKAYDDVVEEANLKHQKMTIEHGENKGQIHPAHWQDLVRADHPNIYVAKDNDDD